MKIDLNTAKNRSILTQKVRDFFVKEGFLEVETPIMVKIPGMEPYLSPFETNFTTAKSITGETSTRTYLNTSPELQMKKLLGSGFGNIFQLCKVFRNGETGSPLHNPEFTMLEWYRNNADYQNLMTDSENLICELLKMKPLHQLPRKPFQSVNLQNPLAELKHTLKGNTQFFITYQSSTVDLTPPWPRFTTRELFQQYCGIDLLENQDFDTFKRTIDQLATTNHSPFAFSSAGCSTWDDLYFKIFLNHIEPELAKSDRPIFIYDYPSSQAALAKKSATNPFFAERFELYIKGIELANAFSELTDSTEQRARLIDEQNLRKSLNKTVFPIDEEFLSALDQIKTPTAGIALGLDRLFMLLLDKKSIDEVLLFPTSLANPLAQR